MLIKAVGEAVPINSLACFKLPESLLEDLHRMMTRFWWGQRDRERKMAWISWEKCAVEREKVGWDSKT